MNVRNDMIHDHCRLLSIDTVYTAYITSEYDNLKRLFAFQLKAHYNPTSSIDSFDIQVLEIVCQSDTNFVNLKSNL